MMKEKMMVVTAALALLYGSQVMAEDETSAEAALEHGEEVFDDCSICQGENAEGGEDYGAPKLAGHLDWYLIRQLKNFRAGIRGTHDDDEFGPVMQPMAAELEDQEIEDVVAYIMTLDQNYDPDAD